MKLYRSIGMQELKTLFKAKCPVIGKYHCSEENCNTSQLQNAVCFFVDNVRWRDNDHRFTITVDIPATLLEFGIGTYYAKETLANTNIWDGASGDYTYGIREAYVDTYSLKNVVELNVFDECDEKEVEWLREKCSENNIVFHVTGEVSATQNEICEFVEDPYCEFDYITDGFLDNRANIVPLTQEDFDNHTLLADTKETILEILNKGDDDAIRFAKMIQKFLY